MFEMSVSIRTVQQQKQRNVILVLNFYLNKNMKNLCKKNNKLIIIIIIIKYGKIQRDEMFNLIFLLL
jgi:hypothetical protein